MKKENEEQINEDTPVYTISTAAELVNVSVHTLRMYEREGLVKPFKKDSGHRLYSQFEIERLKCINDTIHNHKISIGGIKGMLSLIPCWQIKKCSEEDRENCNAYSGSFETCWSYKHEGNVCANEECRLCEVFKVYGSCHELKWAVKKFTGAK